mmetsp:Transcript_68512/g.123443  ORF Transcript_68512/g.123443 Transcript_68512/m.123443 type:complete len:489 (+) Transcript_68512:117-1583(+)
MGTAGSSSKEPPLDRCFGSEEQGKRGPTLGSVLIPGPQEGSWRLILVAPLRIQVFDGHGAKALPLEDEVQAAIREHSPFTAFCSSEDFGSSADSKASHGQIAVGCQDGTVLVFSLSRGTVCGPVHELKVEDTGDGQLASEAEGDCRNLAMSVTALHLHGSEKLFAGACGRCFSWDLHSGELQREFHLPGASSEQPSTPSTLVAVTGARGAEAEVVGTHLWVGLDTGVLAVFDAQTGVLVRSFSCAGPEVVVSLAFCPANSVVFALSAHKRVSIWDSGSYACLQKYPAELMTCGSDLSAMAAINLRALDMSLLLLAGVDGSLCVRRITRRPDRKLNCVLLWYVEHAGFATGCPVTSIDYHPGMDSVLLGDAGCNVMLLQNLREQLGASVEMVEPGARPPPVEPAIEPGRGELQKEAKPIDGTGSASPPLPPPAQAPHAAEALSPAAEASPHSWDERTEEGRHEEGPPIADVCLDVLPEDGSAAFPVFSG